MCPLSVVADREPVVANNEEESEKSSSSEDEEECFSEKTEQINIDGDMPRPNGLTWMLPSIEDSS